MSSTYSPLKIELIATGDKSGTWGNITNANLGTALEEAIVGRATVLFPADANLTLTLTDTNASQTARHFVLNVLSGVSLTTTRDLILPAIEKPYIIQNNTTGGQSIRAIVGAGSVTIPSGRTTIVYNDGVDVRPAVDFLPNLVVTGTLTAAGTTNITGAIDLSGDLIVGGNGSFGGTSNLKVPAGTNAQRPMVPVNGMLRYNSDLGQFEGYADGLWGSIGGAQAGGAILINKDVATVSYTIADGENGVSVGPLTVDSGVSITVASGQRWLIL
jgi:hypothetical protein